jgi:7,8-dihydropterin-6-yl-methyl-4-(beta-D-ribofuranosyl)aminobenzene 5'-phosphate synthase
MINDCSLLIKSGVLFHDIHDPSPICQGVYSTGELGLRIKEQSLIICTDQGFILITGCAHPGIVQIVRTARELIQESPLLVIGGFHLAQKNASELKGIISNMKALGARSAAPCHCSGDLTRQMFDAAFGDQYIAGGVGRIIRFDANNRACSDLNEPIENAGNR